jgi:alpha-methylacyl-CoA racemase
VEARGRTRVHLDLKDPAHQAHALRLADGAHILIEGFRPGVMERLGLGPDLLLARNPRLVYGRMTGWGQSGPLAGKAGHDLNYLALTGALHALGPRDKPAVPLNLIGDFGGGALYLALGVLAGLHHARATGTGQVVDAAMTDGVISLLGMIYGDFADGRWVDQRESNPIDGAAPFYDVYRCRDGKWLALAAIEPQFYGSLWQALREAGVALPAPVDRLVKEQWQRASWPALRQALASAFATRTRDAWCTHFSGHDACIAPVLSLAEAPRHPHNLARRSFVESDGVLQPAAAPRLGVTAARIQGAPHRDVIRIEDALRRWA